MKLLYRATLYSRSYHSPFYVAKPNKSGAAPNSPSPSRSRRSKSTGHNNDQYYLPPCPSQTPQENIRTNTTIFVSVDQCKSRTASRWADFAPKTSAGQSIDGTLVFADIGCRCSTTHCCWKFPFALPLQSCGWGMLIRTTHSSECTPIGKRAWAKATTPVETVAQSIATSWLS